MELLWGHARVLHRGWSHPGRDHLQSVIHQKKATINILMSMNFASRPGHNCCEQPWNLNLLTIQTLLLPWQICKLLTTVFVDRRLWRTKHPRKRFQNFRQSYVLSTDRIEIHQSQPLVWPSDILYVMLAVFDWWISIRYVDNTWRLTEI